LTELAERLRERYFGGQTHPYVVFEDTVSQLLRPEHTLLDAGCGRTAPVLVKYRGRADRLIGVDLVEFDAAACAGLEVYKGDLVSIPVATSSVDVVMARSVMEHVEQPLETYREVFRALRPGGHFVFLTANLWDYVSIVSRLIPNRFHPWIVARTEGRAEHDVFPIQYRTNTRGAVRRFSAQAGFELREFRYLGQYPAYFMFNGALFFLATGYEKLISRYETLAPLRGWILAVLRKTAAVN
jgi:SAM-dependent methyltransferase